MHNLPPPTTQRKEILVQKRNYILDTSPELTQKIRLVEKYRPDGTVNPAYPSRLLPYGQMPKSLFLIGEFPVGKDSRYCRCPQLQCLRKSGGTPVCRRTGLFRRADYQRNGFRH